MSSARTKEVVYQSESLCPFVYLEKQKQNKQKTPWNTYSSADWFLRIQIHFPPIVSLSLILLRLPVQYLLSTSSPFHVRLTTLKDSFFQVLMISEHFSYVWIWMQTCFCEERKPSPRVIRYILKRDLEAKKGNYQDAENQRDILQETKI